MFVVRQDASAGEDSGLDPNLNIGGSALGAIWFLVSLAMIVVSARVYTQVRITRQVGWSDYLAIMSVLTVTGFASLISVQYHYGWGRHQVFVDEADTQQFLKYNYAGQPFGIMGSTFGRMSFIVLLAHLFGSRRWQRIFLWTLFVLQIITNIATVILIFAQCQNPKALYDFSVESECWPSYVQTYMGYGHTAFNGLTDLMMTVYPAWILWNVQMDLRLKGGLCVLLGLNILAFVGTMMKIVKLDALSNEADYTYNTVAMFTWIVVETVLVNVAASVPLLRPLVKKLTGHETKSSTYDLPKYKSKSASSSSGPFSKLAENESQIDSKHNHMVEELNLPIHKGDSDGIVVQRSYNVQYSTQ